MGMHTSRLVVAAVVAVSLGAAGIGFVSCSDATEGTGGGAVVENTAVSCGDGVDNDGDGYTDCDDQDCWQQAACAGSADASGGTDGGATDTSPADGGGDASTPADTPGPGDGGGDSAPADAPTPPQTCEPCGYGEVIGRVCAPNEQIFVNDATVWVDAIDCDGELVHIAVKSDTDGNYHLKNVPCGKQTINIDKGSFHRDFTLTIEAGEVHDVSGAAHKLCFQANAVNIAVLAGTWDSMEGLLTQLGFDYDFYESGEPDEPDTIAGLLLDPLLLAKYEIIFANCGTDHGWMPQENPDAMDNMKDWVLDGGSLYMSDYAWTYGEYGWPDAIEYFGSDNVFDMFTDQSPQLIQTDTSTQGAVLDGTLAAYLGKTQLAITFDAGPQIAPQAAGAGSMVHVQGKIVQPWSDPPLNDEIPLLVSYVPAAGAGRVIYTNFHNDAQATEDILKVLYYMVFTL